MLRLPSEAHLAMVAHALASLPEEACGLMVGSLATGTVERYERCRNAAASAKVYTIDPRDHLRVDREAEDAGLEIVGVVHSHTHTEAYPSPTDVASAPDPEWHYLIVSLRLADPVVRSYRIRNGEVVEEPVVVE